MSALINSEIGKLERVVVHSPGREIESMSPDTARSVLYNDIIPLSIVAEEHAQLAEFLSLCCEVVQVRDLFTEVLASAEAKRVFLDELERRFPIRGRRDELDALSSGDLAEACISGLGKRSGTLDTYLSEREFDLFPLPNLYFTRDSGMVYRDGLITGSMARGVRSTEALIMDLIFRCHPLFEKSPKVYDGAHQRDSGAYLEGGDFHVFDEGVLLLGISERTTPAGIDNLVGSITEAYPEKLTVFAVILPHKRAAIHLDMICSQIDRELFMVYEPYILGKNRLRTVRIDVEPGREPRFTEEDGLIEGLGRAGYPIEAVVCGGSDPVVQQREQWMSAANLFAFAPGKVIGYSCNDKSFEALAEEGFAVERASAFIEKEVSIDDYERLAVMIDAVELARGGGGIRCMTMPLERA
jgi:arginine deiminase